MASNIQDMSAQPVEEFRLTNLNANGEELKENEEQTPAQHLSNFDQFIRGLGLLGREQHDILLKERKISAAAKHDSQFFNSNMFVKSQKKKTTKKIALKFSPMRTRKRAARLLEGDKTDKKTSADTVSPGNSASSSENSESLSDTPPAQVCHICRVNDVEIQCDCCGEQFHFKCLKMSSRNVDKLDEWQCPDCEVNNTRYRCWTDIILYPEGEKSVKKVQLECKQTENIQETPKSSKRGRPKGSVNKSKKAPKKQEPQPPKKRGRPFKVKTQ